jgi:hypothetical protein
MTQEQAGYQPSEAPNQKAPKDITPAAPPATTPAEETINGSSADAMSYEQIPSEEVAPELQHTKD